MNIDAQASGGDVQLAHRPGWGRLVRRGILASIVLAFVGFAGGFLWFATSTPVYSGKGAPDADAIVVLTGGPARVVQAVDLLAAGRGKRLLITGVGGSSSDLARWLPGRERLFACCVDIDRAARNTFENAVETRRWAVRHRFGSLLVVTSSYHMRRALAEIAHRLPDVRLIPSPVVTERWVEPWWVNTDNAKTLMIEYMKFLAVLARLRIAPDVDIASRGGGGAADPATARRSAS